MCLPFQRFQIFRYIHNLVLKRLRSLSVNREQFIWLHFIQLHYNETQPGHVCAHIHHEKHCSGFFNHVTSFHTWVDNKNLCSCLHVFFKMPVSKVRNDLSSSVQKCACLWRPVTVKDNRTQKLFSRLFVIVEAYNAWFHSTQMRVAMFVSTFGNKIASSCCCMWPCLCSVSLWCLWRDRKIRDVFETENFF